jgi:phage tail-like protein
VTVPDATIEPIEYRDGNEPNPATPRKLPGVVKYGNISLKWGITDAMDLYNWHRAVSEGTVERKTVSIIVVDEEGNDKSRWEFSEAWPTKYDAPELVAKGNDVSIETLEIVHEGMKRIS